MKANFKEAGIPMAVANTTAAIGLLFVALFLTVSQAFSKEPVIITLPSGVTEVEIQRALDALPERRRSGFAAGKNFNPPARGPAARLPNPARLRNRNDPGLADTRMSRAHPGRAGQPSEQKREASAQFRRPPRRTAVPLRPVLSGGELQVPVIDEPPLLFQASDALALIRLDLQAPSAAEVREVSRNRTPPRSSAGHFHHHFRDPPHRARDLLNLCAAESSRHLQTGASVAHDLEQSRSIRR